MNYTTYTDESYITGERFRSIAAFSFATEKKQEVDSKLKQILQESSVSEFKWQKVKDAKYKFCAIMSSFGTLMIVVIKFRDGMIMLILKDFFFIY